MGEISNDQDFRSAQVRLASRRLFEPTVWSEEPPMSASGLSVAFAVFSLLGVFGFVGWALTIV
jgi:hypothetical protein